MTTQPILFGRPIVFSDEVPTLGNGGDLRLISPTRTITLQDGPTAPDAPYVLDDFELRHEGDVVEDGRTMRRIVAVEKAPRRPDLGPLTATSHLEGRLVESLSPAVRFREEHRAAIERGIVRAINEVFAATQRMSGA